MARARSRRALAEKRADNKRQSTDDAIALLQGALFRLRAQQECEGRKQ